MLFPGFCNDTSKSSIFSIFWLVVIAEGSGEFSDICWGSSVGTGGCPSFCGWPDWLIAISWSGNVAGPEVKSWPQSVKKLKGNRRKLKLQNPYLRSLLRNLFIEIKIYLRAYIKTDMLLLTRQSHVPFPQWTNSVSASICNQKGAK